MSTPAPIRIGVLGAGSIVRQRHAPGLAGIAHAHMQVVCNRSEASGKAAAAELGIPEVAVDWREVVARDDLDAILIGTWPYTHREMATAALAAGKHVLCQARMAGNLEDARAMVAAAEASPGLVHMVCPPPHRMPYEPYIRALLKRGELGEIRAVRLASLSNADLGEAITWREQVKYSGQQALQVGIWAEALHAWLGEYRTLRAVTATPIGEKGGEAIEVPQVVLIQGELENGAVISEHHSGVALHEPRNFVSIYGSDATLRINAAGPIKRGPAGGDLAVVDVPEADQRPWRVERDFIEAVDAARAGRRWAVSPDFHEGLGYMRKVAAVHASAASGKAVKPAELG